MFGFVVANPEKLTEEQKNHYKSVYCGLCEELGHKRGLRYRMALTYDLVFLAVVLSAVFDENYEESTGRCPVHPTKTQNYLRNRFTHYASDMNIALAYYKYMDDWTDDRSYSSYVKLCAFRKEISNISENYPYQCSRIAACLEKLSETEKHNVLIPDVPAEIFGELLGSVFKFGDGEIADKLYEFGVCLGKFIYILDAAVDLKGDIRRKRYNPLIRYSITDIEPVLHMLMAECVEKYRALPVKKDKELIENILFSGIWTSYDAQKKGKV